MGPSLEPHQRHGGEHATHENVHEPDPQGRRTDIHPLSQKENERAHEHEVTRADRSQRKQNEQRVRDELPGFSPQLRLGKRDVRADQRLTFSPTSCRDWDNESSVMGARLRGGGDLAHRVSTFSSKNAD